MSDTTKTIEIGETRVRLEGFDGRRGIRVIRTIEHITRGVPEILRRWADFTREYEAANVTEMDRAFARSEFRPQPIMDQEPIIEDGKALTDDLGRVLVRTTPHLVDGVPVLGPDPLGHMTEEDWQASGNRLRIPKSPSIEERVAAIFPMALDLAEEETLQLLALLSMTNAEYKRAAKGDVKAALQERAEELLDAPADALLELAVSAGEMVEEQFMSKIRALGDRLPNALRLFGMSPKGQEPKTSTTSASSTKPTSSTDSPPPTDGESDEPSAPDGDSLPLSASA